MNSPPFRDFDQRIETKKFEKFSDFFSDDCFLEYCQKVKRGIQLLKCKQFRLFQQTYLQLPLQQWGADNFTS